MRKGQEVPGQARHVQAWLVDGGSWQCNFFEFLQVGDPSARRRHLCTILFLTRLELSSKRFKL